MRTIRIKAHAPTVYQFGSLRAFGLTTTDNGPGGKTGIDYFDSEEEAVEYLKDCVDNYYASHGTEEEIKEKLEDCEQGYLELDAVTAHIESATYHSDDEDDVTWN